MSTYHTHAQCAFSPPDSVEHSPMPACERAVLASHRPNGLQRAGAVPPYAPHARTPDSIQRDSRLRRGRLHTNSAADVHTDSQLVPCVRDTCAVRAPNQLLRMGWLMVADGFIRTVWTVIARALLMAAPGRLVRQTRKGSSGDADMKVRAKQVACGQGGHHARGKRGRKRGCRGEGGGSDGDDEQEDKQRRDSSSWNLPEETHRCNGFKFATPGRNSCTSAPPVPLAARLFTFCSGQRVPSPSRLLALPPLPKRYPTRPLKQGAPQAPRLPHTPSFSPPSPSALTRIRLPHQHAEGRCSRRKANARLARDFRVGGVGGEELGVRVRGRVREGRDDEAWGGIVTTAGLLATTHEISAIWIKRVEISFRTRATIEPLLHKDGTASVRHPPRDIRSPHIKVQFESKRQLLKRPSTVGELGPAKFE
ncbi:hypothetical protein C8R45DRAFT_922712 [Mycena sanguinolenta]|nr:hypothetical protein C8R45DRAFT_922712 [Mycena sanguinolenta]